MKASVQLVGSVLRDLRVCGKQLALTDLTYKLLTFILLTPAVSFLFHLQVQRSGRSVFADEDILQFVLEPAGWVCLCVTGALIVALMALEQAALMGILCAADSGHSLSVVGALRFAGARTWPVLRVAGRIVVLTLVALSPCLAVVGGVYWALLTEFDINYYLAEKPPAFWMAVSGGGAMVLVMVAIVLRLATSWFFALPLVCFERVAAHRALRLSRDRVVGHRPTIVVWIVLWLAVTMLLSALATTGVVAAAQWLVPRATGSLLLLLLTVGTTLLVWSGLHVAINLATTISFAAVYFRIYRRLAAPEDLQIEPSAGAADAAVRWGALLTRKRVAAFVLCGTVLALAIGVFMIRRVRTLDHCEVIAHRGASASAPENTLAAVREAVAQRADWVEIDVQESADGEVVVFHDSDFMKLARRNLNIWNATRADLDAIDIGSWLHPDYRDERVPTLADVLAACRGKARVLIELKYYGRDQDLEARVAHIVEAHEMLSETMVMSLQQRGIDRMKKLRPEWPAGLLTAVAVGDLSRAPADFLAVKATLATRAFVRSAHGQNKKVYAWTVNDPITMSTLIGRGVDGIITDDPALARRVLAERAELSSVERLLIAVAGRLGVTPPLADQ